MTLPYPTLWAAGNESRTPFTPQERNAGLPCGAADPDKFDALFHNYDRNINRLTNQLATAATAVGLTFNLADATSLDQVLKTYQDIIKENLTVNVPADFPDVVEAMIHLSQFRISEGATVIVNVAAGTYNHGSKVIPGHPDGLRIKIVGPALPSGMVTQGEFQVTGSSEANIATDRIVNESMLRSRFPVRIQVSGTAVDTTNNAVSLQNILFIGSGGGTGIRTQSGVAVAENVSCHNFEFGWLVDRDGLIFAPGCTSSGCFDDGWQVTNNGTIFNENGIASGNNRAGYRASVGGTVVARAATSKGNGEAGFMVSIAGIMQAFSAVAKNNAGDGFFITLDGTMQARETTSENNGGWGYHIFNGGRMNAGASTATDNADGGYRVQSFGGMTITGKSGSPTTSPTVNTVGNGNGYIRD